MRARPEGRGWRRPGAVLAVTAASWLLAVAAPAGGQETSTTTSDTSTSTSSSTSTTVESTTTTTAAVPLSKEEYVARANEACAQGARSLLALPRPETPDEVVPWLREYIDLLKAFQAQLRALVPPPGDTEFLETHLLGPIDEAIAIVETFTDAVEQALREGDIARIVELGTALEARAEQLAVHDPFLREYGLVGCAGAEEIEEARDAGTTVSRSAPSGRPPVAASGTTATTLANTGRPIAATAAAGTSFLALGVMLVVAAHYRRRELERWDLLPARARWRVAWTGALRNDPVPSPVQDRAPAEAPRRFVL